MDFLIANGRPRLQIEGLGSVEKVIDGAESLDGSFTLCQMADGRLLLGMRGSTFRFSGNIEYWCPFSGVGRMKGKLVGVTASVRVLSMSMTGAFGRTNVEYIFGCQDLVIHGERKSTKGIANEPMPTLAKSDLKTKEISLSILNYFGVPFNMSVGGIHFELSGTSPWMAREERSVFQRSGGYFETGSVSIESDKELGLEKDWERIVECLRLALSLECGWVVGVYDVTVGQGEHTKLVLREARASNRSSERERPVIKAETILQCLLNLSSEELTRFDRRMQRLARANDHAVDLVAAGLEAAALIDSLRGHWPNPTAAWAQRSADAAATRSRVGEAGLAVLAEVLGDRAPALEGSLLQALAQFGRMTYEDWLRQLLEDIDVLDATTREAAASIVRRARNSLVHQSRFAPSMRVKSAEVNEYSQLMTLNFVAGALLARSVGVKEGYEELPDYVYRQILLDEAPSAVDS